MDLQPTRLADARLTRPPFDLDAFDRWIALVGPKGGSIHTDMLFLGARGEDDPSLALRALGQAVRLGPESFEFSLDLGLKMSEEPCEISLDALRNEPAYWPPVLHATPILSSPWWWIFEEPDVAVMDIGPIMPDAVTMRRLNEYRGYAMIGYDAEEEAFRRSIIVTRREIL